MRHDVEMDVRSTEVQLTEPQLVRAADVLEGDPTPDTLVDALLDHIGELRGQLAEAQAELVEATPAEPSAHTFLISDGELDELAAIDDEHLQLCVDRGALTPAVARRLAQVLLGQSGQRPRLTLSRGGDGSMRLSRAVIECLKENRPVAFGAQTGVQSLPDPLRQQEDVQRQIRERAAAVS